MNFANIGRHTIAAPLAAFTLVAGGGIALAASGGGDPAPQAAEHRPVADPVPTPTVEPTEEPTEEPTDEATNDAAPSPSLTGLCKAARAGGYAASTKNGHVNPAWSALESAAGGASNVDSYCDATLAADAAAKAARRGPDVDDSDDPRSGKPAKGANPGQAHRGDNDDDAMDNDDADEVDNDDAGEFDNDDAGEVDNDDAGEADSDDDGDGDGGSRASEHRKN